MVDDAHYANDVRAALEAEAPRTAWTLIGICLAMLAAGGWWAATATVEEVTTGMGQVIPTRQTQLVQSLDGGIVQDIAKREGDIVEAGEVLMRIDDTNFSARLGELLQKRAALTAETIRLRAESNGDTTMLADEAARDRAANYLLPETNVFNARLRKHAQDLAVLREQLAQQEQQLEEFRAQEAKLEATLVLLDRQIELTEQLRKRGAVPELEALRLQREAAEMNGELAVVRAAVPRARSAIAEVNSRIDAVAFTTQLEAREKLAKAEGDLAIIEESIRAANDRVERTVLRSPVRGIINKIGITTIGAVVQPGQSLIEIVPLDDALLIEARIRPQDVAFVRAGQQARVKLSAYDYLIYGAIDAKVVRVSPNTISTQDGETFYQVIVETTNADLAESGKSIEILPGMQATVDISTGSKTVLDYLLKPVLRVREEALREP